MKRITTIMLRALCVLVLLPYLVPVASPQSTSSQTRAPRRPRSEIENAAGLASFFRALTAIKSGRRQEPVRIMHFGDSHIAADILTAELRRRLQTEFGDAGPGFMVPRNPMSTRRRGVVSGATAGWSIEGIGGRIPSDQILAPAGISLSTSRPNERAWLQALANHFEIYFVRQPGGGRIDVTVDGVSVIAKPLSLTARTPQFDTLAYDAPDDAMHRLEIGTLGAGKVRILGIVAERLAPLQGAGVSYDTLGINGARATRLLSWDQAAFTAAVARRKPDLIIVAYGTNEAGDLDWTSGSYQLTLATILHRLHSAAPQASLLVYGPPDRSDSPLPAQRLPAVTEAERSAALEAGAAFWSSYEAMGGADSMSSWVGRGLGQGDHVHLTSAGYARVADLFYQELMRAYSKTPTRPPRTPVGNDRP